MRVRGLLGILAAACLIGAPAPARAECAGFTDVDVGGFLTGFCANVTWIKNRSITLGCTSATLYCPNADVARLSMALFMNRLGNVFTPLMLDAEEAGGLLDLTSQTTFLCQSDTVPVAPYRRRTLIDATFSFAADGPGVLQFVIGLASGAGAFSPLFDTVALVDYEEGRGHVSTMWISLALQSASTQRYAVRATRFTGSGNVTNWTCSLQASVINDNQP
jgi:hypothetical protein